MSCKEITHWSPFLLKMVCLQENRTSSVSITLQQQHKDVLTLPGYQSGSSLGKKITSYVKLNQPIVENDLRPFRKLREQQYVDLLH